MFKIGDIDGFINQPVDCHTDKRGFLFEIYRVDEIDVVPAMAYASYTFPGISRGPHEHNEQTDVFVFGDAIFQFFVWDNRPESATFCNKQVLLVGAQNKSRLIVPPGIVHAYRNISSFSGLVLNAPDKLYAGRQKRDPVDEIRHELDPMNKFRLDMEQHEIPGTC